LHEHLNNTTIYVTHDQIEAMTMATRIVVMKDGRIQQIGGPKEIYDNPNNMFVGGFIGTPAMNFLPGTVKKDGYFYGEGLKLQVPEEKVEMLQNLKFIGKPIMMGIRPEDLHDDKISFEKHPESRAKLTVDVSELLGAETNIHITIGDANIIAKVDARSDLRIGDPIELAFNMHKCHFFDPETEIRMTPDYVKPAQE